jgi:hypothetical protein
MKLIIKIRLGLHITNRLNGVSYKSISLARTLNTAYINCKEYSFIVQVGSRFMDIE